MAPRARVGFRATASHLGFVTKSCQHHPRLLQRSSQPPCLGPLPLNQPKGYVTDGPADFTVLETAELFL